MLVLACLAAGRAAAPEGPDPAPYDLPVPLPSTSTLRRPDDPKTQDLLVELRERGILAKGEREWEPEDMKLLERMRQAERLRAFDLLRERAGTLRGLAVNYKREDGSRVLWLTREGFGRYAFLKSQQARKYFEQKGTDAKWVFRVRDPEQKKLFDSSGLLTPAGEAVYTRIMLGLPTEWLGGDGRPRSNVRPKKP